MTVHILAAALSILALGIVTSGILFLIAKAYAQALLDKQIRRKLPTQTTSDQHIAVRIAHGTVGPTSYTKEAAAG